MPAACLAPVKRVSSPTRAPLTGLVLVDLPVDVVVVLEQ